MTSQGVTKGIRGGGIVIWGSLLTAVLQFVSVVVLSRLISPDDFGLIAMVGVFVALGNLIRDFGLPMAALQEDKLSPQQASNLFWMNAVLAGLAGIALIVMAPLISFFYSEPRLIQIVPAMGVTVIILGIGAQLQVKLARSMRYITLVVTDLSSQVVGLIVACVLAYYGAGYWSLVAQSITVAVVLLASRWIATKWAPMRFRRGHGSFAMFRSGSEYGLAHFLSFLQNNADAMIIGATLGATPLGLYNRAYQLLTAPASRLLTPLTQVIIPTVNRIRQDGQSYVPFLLKVQFAIGSGLVLLFAITAGTANELIPLALGPGWEQVVPIFQILAFGGVFSTLSNVSYWAFIINQQSRQLMRYNLVTKPMVILFVFFGSFFGLIGVAIGFATGLAISWPINLIWLSKTADLPGWQFFRNGMGIACRGFVAALITWIVTFNMGSYPVIATLCVGVLTGVATYIVALCLSKQSRTYLVQSVALVRTLLRRV